MRVVNIGLVVGFLVAVVLTIVATPTPWFTAKVGIVEVSMSLWEQKSTAGSTETTYKPADMCEPMKTRLQAGEAFAIISIFVGCVAAALAIMLALGKQIVPLTIGMIPSFAAAACCLIVWCLQANMYSTDFKECVGGAISKLDGATLSVSFALFLIASVAFPVLAIAFWFLNKNTSGFNQI